MVAGVILAFFFGWKMALLVLAIFPLVGFGGYIRLKLREGGAKNDNQLLEEAGKVLGNIESVVHLYTQEPYGRARGMIERNPSSLPKVLDIRDSEAEGA